ncbi:MAG: stage II sporulation protein D [Clostridia bacterium]|nr:stage II sporulation protein D [Clostridia bacterium]
MKGTFCVWLVIFFSMLVIPLSSLPKSELNALPIAKPQDNITYEKENPDINLEKIKVLKDEVVTEYDINDYIFGVVAAEMPALYEPEALKAQAVAAYTFACYKKSNDNISEYDITADGDTSQCFVTREEAATRWGEKAEEYTQKIDDCIKSVLGEFLSYDDKPIFAAYHAISTGITNDCKDVWDQDLPYLKSVKSIGDPLAEGFLTEVTFTREELEAKLSQITSPTGEPQNYFSEVITNDNGYVSTLNYCGKDVSGAVLRELLELRSTCFVVSFSDDVFKFTVKGYGHGVGMSQNGANYMAKQGSNYKEILLHYYNGATLQKN